MKAYSKPCTVQDAGSRADRRWSTDARAPKILSLNVRSLRSPTSVSAVADLVAVCKPWVLCLQETKLTDERSVASLLRTFPAARAFASYAPSASQAGTITLVLDPSVQVLECHVDPAGCWVRLNFTMQSTLYTLLNVYLPPGPRCSQAIGALPHVLGLADVYAGILVGDFNFVNSTIDKAGGSQLRRFHSYEHFCRVVADVHRLADAFRHMHPHERMFSHVQRGASVQTRIDQCFVSQHVLDWVLDCWYLHYPSSDHDALLLTITTQPLLPRSSCQACPPYVLNVEPYKSMVVSSVQAIVGDVAPDPFAVTPEQWDALQLRFAVACASAAVQYTADKRVAVSAAALGLQHASALAAVQPSSSNVDALLAARQHMRAVQAQFFDEQHWRRKYAWVDRSERPCADLSRRLAELGRRPTLLHEVQDDFGTHTDPCAVQAATLRFYQRLYTPKPSDRSLRRAICRAVQKKFFFKRAWMQAFDLTLADCTAALRQLAHAKCPGSTGLCAEFYQLIWPHISQHYWSMLQSAMTSGRLPQSFLQGIITLIHKRGVRHDLGNYRPITLLNADYKILAKALANKMQPMLQAALDPDQTGFVRGRSIKDNAMLTQLLIDRQLLRGEGLILACCDFHKAYDSLARPFLFDVLQAMGVPAFMRRWATLLYTDTCAAVLVNGALSASFPQASGVRQGCPWAPLLFNCAMEALCCFLKQDASLGVPVAGRDGGPPRRLLLSLYADDTTAFLPDPHQLVTFKQLMRSFGRASGLELNAAKTKCMFVASSLSADQRVQAAAPFRALDHAAESEPVLGIPIGPPADQLHLMHNKVCAAVAVLRRLSGLNLCLLGRSRAAKAYVFSRLVYLLDMCAADASDLRALQHAMFDFVAQNRCRQRVPWWRMALSRACQPLSAGGLGVVHVRNWVAAARIKWLVRFVAGPDHAWQHVFADVFGPVPRPVVVPRRLKSRLSVTLWINKLLPAHPVLQGAPARTAQPTQEFILSQSIFDNPHVLAPPSPGRPAVPLRAKDPKWRPLAKRFPTVRSFWDPLAAALISWQTFFNTTAIRKNTYSRYVTIRDAITAAWPDIALAPLAPVGELSVLVGQTWFPARAFRVSEVSLALLDPAQSAAAWWRDQFHVPHVPASLFSRLLRLPIPPAAKQILLLYADGALALRGRLGWLPPLERVCPLCEAAADDPLHFPARCLALHAVWELSSAVGRLLGMPLRVPDGTSLIEFLAQPPSQLSDCSLVIAALYLHAAWRARGFFHEHAALPTSRAVGEWLGWDLQTLLNLPDSAIRRQARHSLVAAGVADAQGEVGHVIFSVLLSCLGEGGVGLLGEAG